MTHPPNSYHYQPATDFETQESEHMYQQSHPSIHMPLSYEGAQRGLQQAGATSGHQRRNNSLTSQVPPPPHHLHNGNSNNGNNGNGNNNGMMYYYDWKNFPMSQSPASFIPSPEEASIHGQGGGGGGGGGGGPSPPASAALGPLSPYHSHHPHHYHHPGFASANPQFMPPPPPQQPPTPSSGSSMPPPSSASYSNGSMAVDPTLAAPPMNASSFMPGPSPNFNNGMSYNFMPPPPPPFGEPYYPHHHRASLMMDMRGSSNGNSGAPMGDGMAPYPAMYQQSPAGPHFSGPAHPSRHASPPAVPNGYPAGIDADYYAPPMPYHPMMMMMSHPTGLHFQHASRSASPSMTTSYSTSPGPSSFHYSHGSSPSPSAFACHPFSRPSLPPNSSSMSNGSGPRLACRPCIRGHRAPSCKHTDRPLFAIRPRGRPSSQCVHCKEARKTGGIHVKCLCGSSSPSPKQNSIAYSPTSPTDLHKSGGMVSAAEPSLKMDAAYPTESSSVSQRAHQNGNNSLSSSKTASNKSALAAVMQSFWSGIHSSENAPHDNESDSASESASSETNVHRRMLPVEATDTVSQEPPESKQSVDCERPESTSETSSTTMHSKCLCDLGMPCLCSSKTETLPKHAEPASITTNLHVSSKSSETQQQRVPHSNQPMDHNSYEHDRIGASHSDMAETEARQQSAEQEQEQEQEQDQDAMLSLEIDS